LWFVRYSVSPSVCSRYVVSALKFLFVDQLISNLHTSIILGISSLSSKLAKIRKNVRRRIHLQTKPFGLGCYLFRLSSGHDVRRNTNRKTSWGCALIWCLEYFFRIIEDNNNSITNEAIYKFYQTMLYQVHLAINATRTHNLFSFLSFQNTILQLVS
jgi:hypothetical protein